MDAPPHAALETIARRHRLSAGARQALAALLDDLLDPRLQLTEAPAGAAPGVTAEPWEDLGLIGRGGMGEVRRVREGRLGRVVAMKLLRDESQFGWFDREARITASLDHPGVPPLFHYGRLTDGRAYFTLREVNGQTLRETLNEPVRDTRALLVALRRAAETVGYAHAQGIVHCDLKPDNLVLGNFGEVWVIDWGIARPVGEHADPATGSPRYMAPEQVRGEPLSPSTDVWALGAVLYEVLGGTVAFPGDRDQVLNRVLSGPPAPLGLPVPPELARLVTRAMAADREARLADGAAFATALGTWLAGTTAREEATRTLEEARLGMERAKARRARAKAAATEAATLLHALPPWAPVEEKLPGWNLEEDASRLASEADAEEAAAAELARAALGRAWDLDAAHDLLADHYRTRLEEAEAAGDPAAIRLEASLRAHDRGAHTAWLKGEGTVTLHTTPAGARVTAYPLLESARRLVPGPGIPLGVTPIDAAPLARGSWLLEVTTEGRRPLRYPVHLGRLEHWHGVPPGGSAPHAIPLLQLPEDDIHVPAGWVDLGGDPRANYSLPAYRRWVDGFVMRRFAVTNREWLAYLDALVAAGEVAAALQAVPRERTSNPSEPGAMIYGFDGTRFFLQPDADGDLWGEMDPIFQVNFYEAEKYAAWLAAQTGQGWRLAFQHEFEKAARGVDRRLYPWGNGYDPTFARVAQSAPGRPITTSVLNYPLDESVYGVRGLAGNMRTWTLDQTEEGRRYICGSYWNAGGATGRCAARWLLLPHQRNADVGIRLVRSL